MCSTMATGIRVEDRLDGKINFRSWRSRLMIVLEENDLLHYVKSIVAEPVEPTEKIAYQKCMVKAKRIIMDSVKDHLIPNIGDLDT